MFFFKQKTAYEMRISDWSSDVCSSDLLHQGQECDSSCTGIRRAKAELCGLALLGQRLLSFNSRPRRSGDPGLHSDTRSRRLSFGAIGADTLTGILQVAHPRGAHSAPACRYEWITHIQTDRNRHM